MKMTRLAVRVQPGAKRSEVVGWEPAPDDLRGFDRMLRVRLAAPPVEGKANAELTRVLAAHFKIRPREVRLVAGERGRRKVVEIPDRGK